MAVPIHRLSWLALRITARIPTRRPILPSRAIKRCYHQTSVYRAQKEDKDEGDQPKDHHEKPQRSKRKGFKFDVNDLDPEARTAYNALDPAGKLQWQEAAQMIDDAMNEPEVVQELTGVASKAANEALDGMPHVNVQIPKIKVGLMAMGEDEPQDTGEDDLYRGDDITSLAHGELEQHREMREYARIAAWEMPLLSKLAKPFHPPSKSLPLRFRYTDYMGETHPAAKKIVLEFCTRDLPSLTEPQRIKLIKLVGPRYNPSTDTVKMSSEMFETQAQNKRYLGDLVDTLMKEASGGDMFEDVPLDFRHHRVRDVVEFPGGWALTEGRRRKIREARERREEEERERVEGGRVVDGQRVVQGALLALGRREEARMVGESEQRGGRPTRGQRRLRS